MTTGHWLFDQEKARDATAKEALDVARDLARHGVPIFVAKPDPKGVGHSNTGFWMPTGWQHTTADPTAVDRWQPGDALCAVMGHGVDLLDVDPRSGGDVSRRELVTAGLWPRVYGAAATPSGGTHEFVADLGVRSHDNVRPGLDVKAGHDGHGHGFAFIAPTVRASKVTGEPMPYRWTSLPDLDALADTDDETGHAIADLVRQAHGPNGAVSPDQFQHPAPPPPWLDVDATITANTRRGAVHKLASALRARGGWREDDAYEYLKAAVFPRLDQTRGGHPYPLPELAADVHGAFTRYPDGRDGAAGVGQGDLPTLIRLDEFLATPDEDITYRVDQIWPTGGRVILAAAWKAGKTTLLGNLIRSVVDDQAFLGRYHVQPAHRVVLVDDELDKRTLRRWLREQGITNTTRVELVALRGKVSTFDIVNPETRARWAKHIGPADVLLFDCLRPVLDALGLAEGNEAGRFLVAFDALLGEAGIAEAAIAHHMGHTGERSRGDSRLRDWPDAEWRLVRDKSNDGDGDIDPAAARYFAAYGRDVDQPEQLLGYDPATRRLTIAGGSRKDTKIEALVVPVKEFIGGHAGCSQNAIEEGVEGRRDHIRKAIALAAERGRVHREKVGNGWVHTLTSPTRPNSPGRTGEPSADLAHSPQEGRGRDDANGATPPNTKRGEFQAALDLFKDRLGATEIEATP